MSSIGERIENYPRKEMHIVYVLDTSGSMHARGKMDMLNHCMKESIDMLKDIAVNNINILFKISVLEFNSGCRWVTSNGPEALEDFEWKDLSPGGLTDIGSALTELNSKLSRQAFFNSTTGVYIPTIIFMTEGYATDDYQSALENIRNNKWFSKAMKFGFAIDNADTNMMASIIGNSEAVIKTSDLELFRKAMKLVSIHGLLNIIRPGVEKTGSDIVKMAKEQEEISAADILYLDTSQYNPEKAEYRDESTYDWNSDGI